MKRKPNPKAPAASPEKFIEVEFVYESPIAKEVYLAGDFNDWSFNSLPMRKAEDGKWRIRVPLSPGRHEYRYIVDGDWQNDPCACGYAPNEFGSCNCVVEAVPELKETHHE
jgi:1,4-alpha-glucan branching enzyme